MLPKVMLCLCLEFALPPCCVLLLLFHLSFSLLIVSDVQTPPLLSFMTLHSYVQVFSPHHLMSDPFTSQPSLLIPPPPCNCILSFFLSNPGLQQRQFSFNHRSCHSRYFPEVTPPPLLLPFLVFSSRILDRPSLYPLSFPVDDSSPQCLMLDPRPLHPPS